MIVIDASVGLKWFLQESEKDRGIALEIQKKHLRGREIIAVPELFFIEIANVLLKKAGVPQKYVREVNSILFQMNLRILSADQPLLDLALWIGSTRKITIYDALYVATGTVLSVPFVTADEKLYNRVNDLSVILLNEFSRTSSS
ncbi:MAG: type II toxin-antitoxin system VapC family toxin [Candidatus Colwellbacteria bacterium]|nr:type II toxin-antitoxin system VapC family toxin [Candidatus Colwellbacteria bacterium]